MRLFTRLMPVIILFFAAACQTSPRTEYLLEITREVTREVTVVVVVTSTVGDVTSSVATPTTAPPPPTETPEVLPTVDLMPTPVSEQIIIAEQLFQGGRMLYVQLLNEIWVMINNPDDPNNGIWRIEADTWDEGMPEFDPDLEVPAGLYQPQRGFGKLWRENEDIQSALGWAIEPEVGHVTAYQYLAGGEVKDGVYIPGPGQHVLTSYYGGTSYVFNESGRTWGVLATSN